MAGNPFAKDKKSDGPSDFNGRVVRRGGKWVVLSDDRKKVISTHGTYREAVVKIRSEMFKSFKKK